MHAPKLTQSKMNEAAEQAALVASLVEEVKAMAPIPDGTLQESFVKPYIKRRASAFRSLLCLGNAVQ